VTFATIWGADRGTGLFLGASPDENVLVLQLFVVITTLPVLCIAGVSGARHGMLRLHRALLASLHDHVAIIDARGVVLEVNESWRRFAESHWTTPFHQTAVGDDFVGACRTSAERGDSAAADTLAGVTRVLNREVGRFEMEYDDDHSRPHGRYALSIEALEHAEGGAVVTRADITARRQAQMELEEQRLELSHLARVGALGQLSGAFAHELNQPLASISNNAEAARLLLRRKPADLSEIDEILRDILAADQRAARVIRRLQALLKRGETRLQPIDAAELVNDVLELASAELITRRITASAVIAPELPLVLADRVQLQQVLLNFILNACEAMRFTPVAERRVSLTLSTEASGNLRFSVRDCGTGIAPALIDHLFEPFVTTKAEGLGLGLSISRTIVAAHGGRLWAENNADRGATVHCLLPAAPAAARVAVEPHVSRSNGVCSAEDSPMQAGVL
jgi:signal transduction histidine kinase